MAERGLLPGNHHFTISKTKIRASKTNWKHLGNLPSHSLSALCSSDYQKQGWYASHFTRKLTMHNYPLLTWLWHCCKPGITTERILLAQVQYLSNCLSSYICLMEFGLYLANYHSGRGYLSSLPAGCLLEEDSSRVHLFPCESLLAVCFWHFHSRSA